MKGNFAANLLATVLFTMISLLATESWGQILLTEPFNYSVSATRGLASLSGTTWTAFNSGNLDSVYVESGNLFGSGNSTLPNSTGNRITYGYSGVDYYSSFNSQSSGTIYASFLMNVSALGTLSTTGGYTIGFIDNGTTNFVARLWIRNTASSGTTSYNLGINSGSVATNTSWASDILNVGTTYLVVISYQIVSGSSNDIAKIWINPTTGAIEPTSNASSTNLTGTDNSSIQRFFIRQDNTTNTPQTLVLDELRVGTTWGSVTPAGCSTPTSQVSIGSVSSTATSMTIPLTAGNGDSRLVRFNTSAPSSVPADGTSYSAGVNTVYGGTEQTVLAGAGTTVTVSSLSPSTLYYYKAWEYNSCGPKYNSATPPSGSFYTLSNAPGGFPATFSATANGSSQINLSFTKLATANITNCAGYLIVQSTSSTLSSNPSNGSAYSVGNTIGNGSVAFINTGNGTSSAAITGLNAGTTYYYYLFPFNWDGTNTATYNYLTAGALTCNATTLAAPSITSPTVTTITNNSALVGANITSNGGGTISDYGVYYATSAGITTASTKFSIGTNNITGVYTGTLGSLTAGTQYFFKGYATNSVGTTLTSTEQSFYTLSNTPSGYPASFTATASSTTQIALSYSALNTLSNCAGYLIVQSTSATLGASPVNGTIYSVGNTIGSGTVAAINSNSTNTATTISSLSPATKYYYFLFPYNGNVASASTYVYLTASAPTCNATTLTPPAPTVTSLSSNSGYYGSTFSIIGTNMNSVTSITIGGVSATNYTIVSNTQIDVTINNVNTSGAVVLNFIGGPLTAGNYTVNGYITASSSTYTTAASWLGGVQPPAGSDVTIAHVMTVSGSNAINAPRNITILSGGSITTAGSAVASNSGTITINSGGALTLGANSSWTSSSSITNNGTISFSATFPSTLTIGGGNFTNNSTLTIGAGTIATTGAVSLLTGSTIFNNLSLSGATTLPAGAVINGNLTLNAGGSLVTNSPTYGPSATLTYGRSSTGTGLEWVIGATVGTAGSPENVTISSGTLTLNGTGTYYLDGNLTMTGNLTMGGTSVLQIKGDVSGAGTFNHGSRKVIFAGTTQTVSSSTTFFDVDVNSTNLTLSGASLTINGKLNIASGAVMTITGNGSYTIGSVASTPSVVSGSLVFASPTGSSLSITNTGGIQFNTGSTYVHNSYATATGVLGIATFATGSTFVYRGSASVTPSIAIANRTYPNLRFESSSGSWSGGSFSGLNPWTVNGDLTIGPNVTLTNSNYSGILYVNGNIKVDGALPTNPINATLTGLNDTISGVGTIRFKGLVINGSYVANASTTNDTLRINSAGSLTLNASTSSTISTINGTLMCNSNIVSGTTFTLGSTGTIGIGHNQGITSSGNQGNIQTTTRNFSTGASYIYNGTASQPAGSGLPATVANLTVNNTGTGANNMVTLAQTTTVTNTLNLLDGHFAATGSIELIVANTSASAITGYASMALANNSSYVEGNLRRKVTTGVYDFPLGTSQNYQLATITVNSNTNVDNILVHFDKFATGCGYNGNTPSFYAKPTNGSRSTLVDDMLNFGYYTVEPYDATYTLVTTPNISYDAQMLFNGHTNGIAGYANVNSYYTLMKKPACGGAWGLYGGSFATTNNQAQNSNSGSVALKLQGLVSFSQFGGGFSSGAVLPLEMTSFTGEQRKDGNALTWTTLSEESTIKFVIERSENADDFTAIGEVAAKGARNSGADYSFLDAKAGTGIHYYRLKAVDVDGNSSYSEMIALGSKGNISNFNVYPNPAANEIHFAYELLQANTQATLKVYSMTGALMHAETLTKNTQEYLLDTRDYQNGLYFYEVIAGGQKLYTGKFNISK